MTKEPFDTVPMYHVPAPNSVADAAFVGVKPMAELTDTFASVTVVVAAFSVSVTEP